MRSLALLSALSLLLLGACTRPAAAPPQAERSRFLSERSYYDDPGSSVRMQGETQVGYKLSRRCAQGPLVLELPILGDKPGAVGEYVYIEMRGPRRVVGHWQAKVPGHPVDWSGSFATNSDVTAPPQNEHCYAPEQQGSAGAGSTTPGATTPGAPSGGPGAPPPPPANGEVVVFQQTPLPPDRTGAVGFLVTLRIDAPVTSGTIKFTFWSEQPNDWDGYLAWVEQGHLVPEDAAKWAAGQQAKKQQDAADHTKGKREADCDNAWHSKKVWTPECQAEFGDYPSFDAKVNACWAAWYKAKIWTDDCRKTTNVDPSAENAKPNGPPPPAPADPQPPKPSVHADWVPGNYHWSVSGKAWVWSPGVWTVPKEDVDSGQTAKAPGAPPPPKSESIPPQPSPAHVWTPGWWAFSMTGWIWIDGAWRVPPFVGATWRPYVWVSAGIGFSLVPGGWMKP